MAMLAEPRRKVRYTVNPTGKDWLAPSAGSATEGGCKFGQRMLHSMGWQHGQGLGRSGQGDPEPIRVKRKADQRGVGCTSAYAAESMPQSVDFASLLSQLNEAHGDGGCHGNGAGPVAVATAVGLEAKSRASRARLHYRKFTRGKDVTSYDAQSLACILGSHSQAAAAAAAPEMKHSRSDSCLLRADAVEAPPPPPPPPAAEGSHGLQLVQSQTSLQDYFRAKMLQLQLRRQSTAPAAATEQPLQEQPEEGPEGWTSESSCSAASTAASCDVGLSLTAAVAAAPTTPESQGMVVIDFGLFPGSDFQRVLGYRLY